MVKLGNDTFEMQCDMVDVTSLHRPDPAWVFIDSKGHMHRWFVGGKIPTGYSPTDKYDLPTLRNVFDYWEYYEDGERTAVSHYECADLACAETGEHIQPGYTADYNTQMVPGLRHYRINGERVSEDEFKRRAEEAQRR